MFNKLFIYTVLIPTLLGGIYYGIFASDIYISESRLVVRTPKQQTQTGLEALLHGTGIARSESDAYTVHDFILSRDAVKKLNKQFNLETKYGNESVDVFKRFAGLDKWNKNFEGLYRYYTKEIADITIDSSSSILVLTVKGFSAEDAFQINKTLVEMSEELVNNLNERSRQDLIRFAMADVEVAEKKAEASVLAIAQYRGIKSVFDPEKQSPMQLEMVEKLQSELIETKAQLAEITSLSKNNPQIANLQRRVSLIQETINQETQKIAGGNQSLSEKAAEYEKLAFQREFSAKQLSAAMAALEGARNEARRKVIYLERLVQPGIPDVAVEPKRLRSVFAVFALGMIAWGISTMLIAGIKEHKD